MNISERIFSPPRLLVLLVTKVQELKDEIFGKEEFFIGWIPRSSPRMTCTVFYPDSRLRGNDIFCIFSPTNPSSRAEGSGVWRSQSP
ncbi:hypothetical protein KGV55_01845 [Candidatus Gracilibacteria bacterium]|nr:hypothetical protein [Candidatus Gracilibacteria bacterium]